MAKNNNPGRILKGTKTTPSLKSASGVWTLDEALQAHRANQWPQPNLYQPVANSLRIKYQVSGTYPAYQNGYLYRFPGRSGNQCAWTWSAWIKYSQGGSSACILGATTGSAASGDYRAQLIIDKGGSVSFAYAQIQIATYINFVWPLYLRDPSAWYHVVLVFDSLNATTANRLRLYVNGVQQTATTTTCPQGQISNINGGVGVSGSSRQSVGMSNDYYGNSAYWYDGLMAEVNLVDGYALQPTQFGQYDSNNAWVPVPYTGSYGTNGYYLAFTNATTSQTLGYDASLTGTTTYGADQDPYRGSVALHLTGNGPAGGQNNSFADSSSTNNAISRTGNVTQGSFSPFPFNTSVSYNPAINGASAYFPKSGWLSAPTAAVSSIGTGDFTFESWVYPIDFTTTGLFQRWFSFGTGLSSDVTVNIDTSGNLVFRINDATQLTSATALSVNNWNHVAFVRSSGTVRIYINGVSGNSASVSTNISTQGGNAIIIGAEPGQSQGSAGDFYGYMSNFRITKGAAIYTANFTPTMRPFGTLTNNLLPFSEDISNSTWTAQSQNVSFTANAAIAPDGTPSATLIVPSTSSAGTNIAGLHDSSAGVNTFSIYAKSAGYRYIQCLHSRSAGGDSGYVTFDLTTGAVTNSSVWSGSIVNVGNGWYRLIATTSSLSGASANSNVRWAFTDGSASRSPAFTGNGTSGIYVWGAQAELASSAGDYTPTPANFRTAPSLLLNFANAAVVDSASASNITTPGTATISSASKYGQGALTFDGSGGATNSSSMIIATNSNLAMGTSDFTVEFWLNSTTGNDNYRRIVTSSNGAFGSGTMCFRHQSGGSLLFGNTSAAVTCTLTPGTWYHICYSRKNYTGYAYLNGQLVGTYTDNNNYTEQIQWLGGYYTAGNEQYSGLLDDVRITKGIARYQAAFTPPSRALPETGGKSFVTTNINAGVVKSFTTTGTTSWTAPTDVTSIEVLVVAAGGTGASDSATNVGNGGGGGGGVIYNSAYPVTPGQTYTVTVGAGQVGLYANTQRSGGNSVFGNLVAVGGGGGGYYSNSSGATGGSGGGGGSASAGGGTGTAGQGFSGGTASSNAGGGGGGAGGPATGTNSRDGGPGLQFGISGTPTYYAGGGGGSASSGAQGAGGIGGGGAATGGAGTNGTANTGGGGGAQINGGAKSGDGGSGVVIVRYTTTTVGNTSDSTTDTLTDSPTLYGHDTGAGGEVVGNYNTLNALANLASSANVLSNSNLTASSNGTQWNGIPSTMNIPTYGKWYWEVTLTSGTTNIFLGMCLRSQQAATVLHDSTGAFCIRMSDCNLRPASVSPTATGSLAGYVVGDVFAMAVDCDNAIVRFYKNGTLNGTWTSPTFNPALGHTPAFFGSQTAAATHSFNFGQRPWAYTPPAGFNALTTKNFARLTAGTPAANPNQYFDTVLWTQGATDVTLVNPGGFQPGLVWIKSRNNSQNHYLMDSVRGTTSLLRSNGTGAESTGSTWITFNSNGFTPSSTNTVTNTYTYVGWQWKAGGAAVANTAGSITSQVSANTTSGFSIVTYTGNTTAGATVGHGLGVAPSFIITKNRDSTTDWWIYHVSLGATQYLTFNPTSAAAVTSINAWNNVSPSPTVFTLGASSPSNANQDVAYCWTEVAGFSKFGSWTNNNNNDGTFVYLGFKPAFVMLKNSDNTETWYITDSKRHTYNVGAGADSTFLVPNALISEGTGNATTATVDLLSNGFKIRTTNPASGEISFGTRTYVYAAFAEKPFGNTNGTAS